MPGDPARNVRSRHVGKERVTPGLLFTLANGMGQNQGRLKVTPVAFIGASPRRGLFPSGGGSPAIKVNAPVRKLVSDKVHSLQASPGGPVRPARMERPVVRAAPIANVSARR